MEIDGGRYESRPLWRFVEVNRSVCSYRSAWKSVEVDMEVDRSQWRSVKVDMEVDGNQWGKQT